MLIFLVAILVDFAFVVVIVIGPAGAFVFSHLQLVATYYVTKRNFQKIFLKLHLCLHIRLLTVACMVADATTVFLQFFLKDSIFVICFEK